MLRAWHRFQSDIQANRQKAALLAGLLLLGCCFWIPMLAKAVAPKHAAAVTDATSGDSAAASAPIPNDLPTRNTDQFWSSLENALERDPLFQSADVSRLGRDPFGLNVAEVAQIQPEIVTEEPTIVTTIVPPAAIPVVPVEPEAESKPRTLRLTSTIISRSRRAALINGQLVTLGRQLKVDGQDYLLTQVDSNRVVLSVGEESFELKMARPQLKDVLDRRSGADPNE